MKTMYILTIGKQARYYDTMEEAIKVAKWAGLPVGNIKEAHVY